MPKVMRVLIFISVLGLVFFTGCKTAGDTAQYTLTVTVAAGVDGTPVTGSYGYEEGDTVPYNYSPQAGYENLEVKLDGAPVASSGVIAMNMNHTLTVTAEEKFNPSGDWEGWLYVMTYNFWLDVTFSGDYAGGTASGEYGYGSASSGIGNGTYTISGNNISFDLEWPAVSIFFSGTINNDNSISGTWDSSSAEYGTWELTRQ